MLKLKDKKAIGQYLGELIDKSDYPSRRQFCKAYLENSEIIVNDEEIRKMSNRLSQIIKGTKAIQTYDLPIFTVLLGVSCEQILSAGEVLIPLANRATNYSIAFSQDPAIWENYINREDKPILNSDEYGKTAIDYALKFGNYAFLKYLVEKGYIWFVNQDAKFYGLTFGGGTSIDMYHCKLTRNFVNIDFPSNPLQSILAEQDCLRMKMIALAIQSDDIDMLDTLRAREIPSLYTASYLNCRRVDCKKYYNEEMMNALVKASSRVLNYFAQEFEIQDITGKHPNTFMFPFLSNLLDLLIPANHKYAETILKRAVAHNRKTYEKLQDLIRESVEKHPEYKYYQENDSSELCKSFREDIIESIKRELEFHEDGNIVLFRFSAEYKGIVTNVINTQAQSSTLEPLVSELNFLYDKIRDYKADEIRI